MSDVLEERLASLALRVAVVEKALETHRNDYVTLLVELKILQTRVSLYAAVISFAVSGATGLLLKFAG